MFSAKSVTLVGLLFCLLSPALKGFCQKNKVNNGPVHVFKVDTTGDYRANAANRRHQSDTIGATERRKQKIDLGAALSNFEFQRGLQLNEVQFDVLSLQRVTFNPNTGRYDSVYGHDLYPLRMYGLFTGFGINLPFLTSGHHDAVGVSVSGQVGTEFSISAGNGPGYGSFTFRFPTFLYYRKGTDALPSNKSNLGFGVGLGGFFGALVPAYTPYVDHTLFQAIPAVQADVSFDSPMGLNRIKVVYSLGTSTFYKVFKDAANLGAKQFDFQYKPVLQLSYCRIFNY